MSVKAKDLTQDWIGRTVTAVGVYYIDENDVQTVHGEIRMITHHSHGTTLRFPTGAALLLLPDSWVIADGPIPVGTPYDAPPVVVGGKAVR